MIKLTGISHLGLAARDHTQATWFFCEVLGLGIERTEIVTEQKTRTSMIPLDLQGTVRLELLQSDPSGEGPIAQFLDQRKGGIHHLAFGVESIEETLLHLASHEVVMIDKVARLGEGGSKIAFVHPKSTGGFLIEFVEEPSDY